MQDDVTLASYDAEPARTFGAASMSEAREAYDVVAGTSLDHRDDKQLMGHRGVPYEIEAVTSACYDFSELGDRNRAISIMCSAKPYVLITSPLCTALSKLTSLNVRHTSPSERKQIANKAQRHLEFICKLIMIQHGDGRYFIHEHPGGISSWQDQCVQEVLTVTQATTTEFDQCLVWVDGHSQGWIAEALQRTQQAREHNASHRLNIQWQTVSGGT